MASAPASPPTSALGLAPPPTTGSRKPFPLRKEGFEKANLGDGVAVELRAPDLHEARARVRAAMRREGFEIPEVETPHVGSLIGERHLGLDTDLTRRSARKAYTCYAAGAAVLVAVLLWVDVLHGAAPITVLEVAFPCVEAVLFVGAFVVFQLGVYFQSEIVRATFTEGSGDQWSVAISGALVRSRNYQVKGGDTFRDYSATLDSPALASSLQAISEALAQSAPLG